MRIGLVILLSLSFSCINLFTQKFQAGTLTSILQPNAEAKLQIQYLNKHVADLRLQLQKQQRIGNDKLTNTSLFLDAAVSFANNLQVLISKESYRNKIVSLNNPTSNEPGYYRNKELSKQFFQQRTWGSAWKCIFKLQWKLPPAKAKTTNTAQFF